MEQQMLSFSAIYRSGLITFDMFESHNKSMRLALDVAKSAATSDAPVLILGETGTGKNLLAQAIHNASRRSGKPFCEVNCGGLHETLQESELFGHVKGAFTGADKERQGLLMIARGGTLFLNEVGDIPTSTQKKLLDVIEYKKFRKLGQDHESETDIRVIAATNRNLDVLRTKGEFRDDFYYRLNCIRIEVPPLRKRRDDIPQLAESFVKEFSVRESKEVVGISREAMTTLIEYDWPGNVRQLRFVIWRALLSTSSQMLQKNDVIQALGIDDARPRDAGLPSLENVERDYILKVLYHTNWNKSRTADILKISRPALDRKIHSLGISRPE